MLIHFDGHANGRHVPCNALAKRFPDDIVASENDDAQNIGSSAPQAPSILQLQFADEDKLVQYLRCEDSTVIQFATAALEGRWIGEAGEETQQCVRGALRHMEEGDLSAAKQALYKVVAEYPEYAYAWSKLGTSELKAGS
jgi:TolA-binding protein